MFKITGNYPTTVVKGYAPTSFIIGSNQTTTPPITTTVTSNDYSLTNGYGTFTTGNATLNPAPSEILSVIYQNEIYYLAKDAESINSNEFTYDSQTGILTIPDASGNFVYSAIAANTTIPTNYIAPPYPNFLNQWNCEGNLQIQRQFQGHPSANAQFTTVASNESAIRSQLKLDTEITLYNLRLMVNSLQITFLSPKKYPGNLILVSVGFTGKWDAKGSDRASLDTQVKIRNISSQQESRLSSLLSQVNVGLTGLNPVFLISPDVDKNTTVVPRGELESRAICKEGFYRYDNPNAVEITKFGNSAIHWLSEDDVYSESYQVSIKGFGSEVNGVKLSKEYRNTKLNLDYSNLPDSPQSTNYILWEYENCVSKEDAARPEQLIFQDGAIYVIGWGNELKTPLANFDTNGVTKSYTGRRYVNGQEVGSHTVKYGFKFRSDQIYSLIETTVEIQDDTRNFYDALYIGTDLTVFDYWGVVEQSDTWVISDEFGYITKRYTSGVKYTRFKQETEAMECLKYARWQQIINGFDNLDNVTTDDQGLQNLINQCNIAVDYGKGIVGTITLPKATALGYLQAAIAEYDFIQTPFEDTTEYTLANFEDYYSDIKKDCSTTAIPQKFVVEETRWENTVLSQQDRTALPDDPKGLNTTGYKLSSKKGIKITSTNPDFYTEINYLTTNLGENFKQGAAIGSSTENQGRPGVAQRLETIPTENQLKIKKDNATYVINTSNSGLSIDDPEYGSISFPDIYDLSDATACARAAIAISNSTDCETFSVNTKRFDSWREGDLLIFKNKYYLITGITDNQIIQRTNNGSRLVSESFEVSLGRLVLPSVSVTKKQDLCD